MTGRHRHHWHLHHHHLLLPHHHHLLLTSSAIPLPQAADPIPLVKAIDDMTEVLSHAGKGLADLMQVRGC